MDRCPKARIRRPATPATARRTAMTHDELMNLPDVTPSFSVDGMVPVETGFAGALFQGDDDGVFWDAHGEAWMTGWIDSVRVRRKIES